jgi:hypothetical protein
VALLRLLPELEDSLRAIPGVRAASVVTGADARPTEVHVLANPGKPAKQVVRDVQSVAMAQFGLDIDHRIVSVVQIPENSVEIGDQSPPHESESPRLTVLPSTPIGDTDDELDSASDTDSASAGSRRSETPAAHSDAEMHPRPALTSITVSTSDGESHVRVDLLVDGVTFSGNASGPGAPAHRPRIVASATLDALTELIGMPAQIESAQIAEAGVRAVALTGLVIHVPRFGDQTLCGSAIVRGDAEDAVARSVLAALNRRLQG